MIQRTIWVSDNVSHIHVYYNNCKELGLTTRPNRFPMAVQRVLPRISQPTPLIPTRVSLARANIHVHFVTMFFKMARHIPHAFEDTPTLRALVRPPFVAGPVAMNEQFRRSCGDETTAAAGTPVVPRRCAKFVRCRSCCLWGSEAVYLLDSINSGGDTCIVVVSLRSALRMRSSLARRSARAVGGPSVGSMRAIRSK